MKYFLKLAASLFSGVIVSIFLASPASAVYFSSGTNLNIAKVEKIDESAFVAGETLSVSADVNGDLFCAGRNITINGNVKGDIICAGQSIKINGLVDGNVRLAAQDIEINGVVARNVSVVSQNLVLAKFSSVKGDIFFGVQKVDLGGSLGRDLAGAGDQININGSLLRNAKVTASSINISDSSKIGGNIDYYVDENGQYNQASVQSVAGTVTRHDVVKPEKEAIKEEVKQAAPTASIVGKLISIISFSLVGFLLIFFTPKRTARVIEIIKSNPFKTFFLGMGISIIAPFVFILSMVTVVGITSAMVVLLFYVISMVISSLYASILVGKLVLEKFKSDKAKSLYLSTLVGCFLVGLVSMVPVIGWLAVLCLYLSGLGAILLSYLPEK